MAWSKWRRFSDILDAGVNEAIPWAVGVYRVRVARAHPLRPGEVIYVGRAATELSSGICRRLGLFAASAMGFWVQHSGGNTFWDERHAHGLNVRDLECAWSVDDDPWCAEYEEYLRYRSPPMLNRQRPRTCGAPGCDRQRAVLARL